MHLLLAGLLSMALSNQIFKMSDPYCPYDLTIHTEISTRSIISCAIYCYRKKKMAAQSLYMRNFKMYVLCCFREIKAWKMKYVTQILDEAYIKVHIKVFILQSVHLLYKYTTRINFCFIRSLRINF